MRPQGPEGLEAQAPRRADDGRNQEPLRLPEGGDGEAGRSDGIEKGD